jgi:hypothetical protein
MYTNNIMKAHALFWGKCTKGMRNKIEARSDFKSKIKNNPFELLKAIKEHSMSYQENRNNMLVIWDSLMTLLNTQQKETKSFQDYTKRFWITREVFESQSGGPIILLKPLLDNKANKQYAMDMQDHEKNKVLQQQTFEQLLAFTYLAHTNQSKYGSILNGLITQQSLRNDQYPKSIGKANNVLSNHQFDIAKIAIKNPNNKWNNQSKNDPEQNKINLSFAQLEAKCFCCGKIGHKSPQCCFKDKPKAEWAINKSQQSHAQTGKTEPKVSKPSQKSNKQQSNLTKSEGWSGVHHQLYQQQDRMNE